MLNQTKSVSLDSSWTEFDSGKIEMEKSFAVLRPMPWKASMSFNKYDQDAFIWSSKNNPLAMYGINGKATFAVDKNLALESLELRINFQYSW